MSRFETALSTRMKRYESVPKNYLMKRTPVIVRIDGRAFHTFTKGFLQPFDEVLMSAMEDTMQYLCENIPGCVLGYKQSDEISLVLVDYQELDTSAWFDYAVQKMCSVIASMATLVFYKSFRGQVNAFREYAEDTAVKGVEGFSPSDLVYTTPSGVKLVDSEYQSLMQTYRIASASGATFDARVFNIPKEEVLNYLVWRQKDAINNSVQMVGQANFDCNELEKLDTLQIKNLLVTKKDINWEDFADERKYGVCCLKIVTTDESFVREHVRWKFDRHIPIFNEDPDYVDSKVFVGQ